ncbi:uncharacterized protein METZ01_LOCUS445321, partial [marine metagenome]
TADVLYDSESAIAGFQFHVDGDVTVTGASGGAAETAGFTVSTGNNTVLGFSMTGATIAAGSGTLLTLEFEGNGSPCLSAVIVSDPDANGLDVEVVDCLTISYEAPCADADADGICDDEDDCIGVYDCAGECNGTSELDECGVCGGDGIADGACDCAGNVDVGCGCGEEGPSGCDNACGSTAANDECGVCGGDNSSCADCAGVPNGDSTVDGCGTCDNDASNDCPEDCMGTFGGDADYDCSGTCVAGWLFGYLGDGWCD